MQTLTLKKTVAAIAIVAALGGAYTLGQQQPGGGAVAAPAATMAASSTAPGLPDMGSIVAANGPAVVNIAVAGSRKTAMNPDLPQLDPDDPFYQFFRRFRVPGNGQL